jgi:hypothetical protein
MSAWSVLEKLLPDLAPEQKCEALVIAVAQWSDSKGESATGRGYLKDAVSAIGELPSATDRARNCIALCPLCDQRGESPIADRLMRLLDDDHHRAVCAMSRAEGYVARREYKKACELIEQARKFENDVSLLNVVVTAAESGDVRMALQLIRRYGQREDGLNGLYRYELLTAALTGRSFEGALAVSHLLRTPGERAGALLKCAAWFTASPAGKMQPQARIELVLAEVECLVGQIENPLERLAIAAALAKAWQTLGDDSVAREIIGPAVDLFLQDLGQETVDHSRDLISTIQILNTLGMKREREAVLDLCKPADALQFRIDLLCDSRQFEEALELIRTSQSPFAASFEDEVLSQAASTPFAEWALDKAGHLPVDAESIKLKRQLTVLEVITEEDLIPVGTEKCSS